MTRQALTTVEADFHERMHAAQIHGLWELASQMTRRPEPKAIAHMWKSSLLEAMVRESGEVVPVGEERRPLQLFNPGLEGRWATTNTMIAAVQLLLPGEVARAHRHTPTAIRFIMEGAGAYTAVDGERVYMEPGDLILTPSWAWHDHGNETDKDRKSTRLNSSHSSISYAVFCLKKKKKTPADIITVNRDSNH